MFEQMKRWDQAVIDYSKVIGLNPGKTQYWMRGNAYSSLNQWDKAITDYSKAIDLDPKDGEIPANRGWVYAELGQWDKAASDYSKAVKLDPQRRFSWQGLAMVLLAKGDGEGYRRACASLIDRFGQTDDPQVAGNVGWLCVQAPDAVAPREEVCAWPSRRWKAPRTKSRSTFTSRLWEPQPIVPAGSRRPSNI